MRYVIELERDPNGRPVGRVLSDSIANGAEFTGWFEFLALLGDTDFPRPTGDAGAFEGLAAHQRGGS
jgi:hypothetical protein